MGSVYERGVAAVPYSVDLWSHYCAFAIQQRHDGDTVRGLFERGLAYVGTDWLVRPGRFGSHVIQRILNPRSLS